MSHHSSSGNGKGTSHKDPLSRILDELSSLKLCKEKIESSIRKGKRQRDWKKRLIYGELSKVTNVEWILNANA